MTDKIIVSRKEIDKLLTQLNITHQDIRAILDKAEVSEPVGEVVAMCGTNGGFSMCVFESAVVPIGTKIYTTPHPNRVAELEAEVARLNAILDDIKVIDNVFGVDDKKDAERYRTIRKSGNHMRVVFGEYL